MSHTHTHLSPLFAAFSPKSQNLKCSQKSTSTSEPAFSGENTLDPYIWYYLPIDKTNTKRTPSVSSSSSPRASPTASPTRPSSIGVVDRRRTSTLQHTHAACFTGVRARRSRELHAHAHSTSASTPALSTLSANDRSIARDRVTPRNRIFNRFAFRVVVVVVDRRRTRAHSTTARARTWRLIDSTRRDSRTRRHAIGVIREDERRRRATRRAGSDRRRELCVPDSIEASGYPSHPTRAA